MKFNNIKYLILCAAYLILVSSCRRTCQDERADNYKDDRKSTCDYSHADNWDKEIIVDSVIINGVKVELKDEGWFYEGAYLDEDEYVYDAGTSSNYSSEFNLTPFLGDTLHSITYYFGIPIASNYGIEKIENQKLDIYQIGDNNKSYKREEDAFNFIEERSVNGVKYRFYTIKIEDIIDKQFVFKQSDIDFGTYIYISVFYEFFEVHYSMTF